MILGTRPQPSTPSLVSDLPWAPTQMEAAQAVQESALDSSRITRRGEKSAAFHQVRRGDGPQHTAVQLKDALALNPGLTKVKQSPADLLAAERNLRAVLAGASYATWFAGTATAALCQADRPDSSSETQRWTTTARQYLESVDKALRFITFSTTTQLASTIRSRRQAALQQWSKATDVCIKPEERQQLLTDGVKEAVLGQSGHLFSSNTLKTVTDRHTKLKEQAAPFELALKAVTSRQPFPARPPSGGRPGARKQTAVPQPRESAPKPQQHKQGAPKPAGHNKEGKQTTIQGSQPTRQHPPRQGGTPKGKPSSRFSHKRK